MYSLPEQEDTPIAIVSELLAQPDGHLAQKLAFEIDQAKTSALESIRNGGMPTKFSAEQSAVLVSAFDGARAVLNICTRRKSSS